MAEYSCVKSTKLVLKGAKEKRWGAGCPPPPPLPRSPRLRRRLRAGASAALPPLPAALGSRRRLVCLGPGQAVPSRPSGCEYAWARRRGQGFSVVSPFLPAGVSDPLRWGSGARPCESALWKGRLAGTTWLVCVSLCSKKKHKEKKRKREEDAAEQLDIVGEPPSGNYVTVWKL